MTDTTEAKEDIVLQSSATYQVAEHSRKTQKFTLTSYSERRKIMEKKFTKETIALNPVVRPKNNQQFMAPRLPYWKTPEYKKAMQERKENVQ